MCQCSSCMESFRAYVHPIAIYAWSLCSSYLESVGASAHPITIHGWIALDSFCIVFCTHVLHTQLKLTSNALRLDLPIEIGTSVSVLFCSLVFFFSVSNKPLPQRPISVCLSARLLVIQLVTLNFDTLHLLLFYSFTGP